MNHYQAEDDDGLHERPEPFERVAAMQLGMIVLAHSRLDMTLERYLQDAGSAAPATFAGKVARLRELAGGLPPGVRRESLEAWAAQCEAVPLLRGDRVRAHWLPDVRTGRLVNLVEPTSEATPEAYAAKELEAVIAALGELQTALGRLPD